MISFRPLDVVVYLGFRRFQMSVTPTLSNTVFLICILLLEAVIPVLSQCSGLSTLTATDDIATFTSPGYSSGSYDNGLSCSWVIDSGSSTEKIIILITHYDVTSPDKIEIHDGFSTSNTTLASITGTGTHKDYRTTGQHALIVFETDASGQAQGFTVNYLKASDLSGTGCTAEQTITATSTPQYITSPAFPNPYTGDSNCRWLIQATEGTVSFELLLSDIENSPNCGFDYLNIYDSSYLCEFTLTVDACTRYPGTTVTYTSNSSSILVKFVSDTTVGYMGFKLKFTSVETVTEATTTSDTTENSGFALGIGVGLAAGVISTLMFIGIVQVIKSRIQASKLGSPRVRNVLPVRTPTSIGRNNSSLNGDVPNGHVGNGHLPRGQRMSVTSSLSSSGNSSRNGRTPSTGNSSPLSTDTQNKYNNNYKRNGVLPTNVDRL